MQHSRAIFRADSFDNGQEGKSHGVIVCDCHWVVLLILQKKFCQVPRGLDFELQETVIERTRLSTACYIPVYAERESEIERDKHFNLLCIYPISIVALIYSKPLVYVYGFKFYCISLYTCIQYVGGRERYVYGLYVVQNMRRRRPINL